MYLIEIINKFSIKEGGMLLANLKKKLKLSAIFPKILLNNHPKVLLLSKIKRDVNIKSWDEKFKDYNMLSNELDCNPRGRSLLETWLKDRPWRPRGALHPGGIGQTNAFHPDTIDSNL